MSSAVPTQSPKSQTRQANEAVILQAAERIFAGAGYGGATMAMIAEAAGLPKANLHYYFGNKQELYRTVLDHTLRDWLAPADAISPTADPRQALESYIRDKMRMSAQRPHASKVFANELLHGAPVLSDLLKTTLRDMVNEKAAVIDGWIAAGRMARVDSVNLFFTIWAATQTYADFDVQIRAVLGREAFAEADHEQATQHVVTLILRGCGLFEKSL